MAKINPKHEGKDLRPANTESKLEREVIPEEYNKNRLIQLENEFSKEFKSEYGFGLIRVIRALKGMYSNCTKILDLRVIGVTPHYGSGVVNYLSTPYVRYCFLAREGDGKIRAYTDQIDIAALDLKPYRKYKARKAEKTKKNKNDKKKK